MTAAATPRRRRGYIVVVDPGDRRAVLSGLAMRRLTLELRTAKLLVQMREGEELRESSQALIAQSERLYAATLHRRRSWPAADQGGEPASS